MSAFPFAHAAHESSLHGIVAMGLRWRNVNAANSESDVSLDYIIECILPSYMQDVKSQKLTAIKCCEALWQISSRYETAFFLIKRERRRIIEHTFHFDTNNSMLCIEGCTYTLCEVSIATYLIENGLLNLVADCVCSFFSMQGMNFIYIH